MAIILGLALTGFAFCQRPGDLVVTPTRVQLDDKLRTGDITLANRGLQTVRYRLTLVDMQMGEEGTLKRVPSTENSGCSFFRIAPREVVLEPGASQRIKIAAYFPTGMPDGEVRSHLSFEPIALRAKSTSDESGGLRISLDFRSILTIPVIARHGHLSATADIRSASIVQAGKSSTMVCELVRSGSRTIRGDLSVWFVPKSGPRVMLSKTTALPVYFPNAFRRISMQLPKDVSSLGTGEIEIDFAEPERSRGSATARAVVKLPT